MRKLKLSVAVFLGFSLAQPVQAQDAGAIQSAIQSISIPQGYASPAFQAPTGSGGSFGTLGIGAYGQTTDLAGLEQDGSLGLNLGLADPVKFVGLDVAAGFSSLFGNAGSGEGFGEAGSLGVKIHRNLPNYCSVAVGWQSFGRWGGAKDANNTSKYVAWSQFYLVGNRGISVTVGAGDQAFSDEENGVGAIGALAFYVLPNVSLIGEYTGRFANVGISVAPIPSLPLSLTAGAVNLNDRYGLGTQFAASIGYGFSLR